MDGPSENSVWKLIKDLSNKKGITEIVINDTKNVFVEREGTFIQLNVKLTKTHIYEFIKEVSTYNKKVCDVENPILDGNLPDGSRINAIIEPYSTKCPSITIRKYLKNFKKFDSSPGVFGLFDKWIHFFKSAVSARLNIVVSGGTGVGKTTFLNLLLQEIPTAERIISIEDTLELSFNLPNIVRLEASRKGLLSGNIITMADLVKNTLRMRPDRIIIGEVRGAELFDLLSAMNTGHDGSMTSVHSNSPSECFQRMETLYLLSGYDVPHNVVRRQISSGVDFIVQLNRSREGERLVSEIVEVSGMEGDNILSQKLATYEDGGLKFSGLASLNMDKLIEEGGLAKDFFNA